MKAVYGQIVSKLFRPGTEWKHRNTGMRVYIKEAAPEGIRFSTRDFDPCWDRYLLRDLWKPTDILNEFILMDGNLELPTAWDHIEMATWDHLDDEE